MKKMHLIIRLFTHKRKFLPEIISLWLKNVNVKEMVGLSVGGIYVGRIRFDTKTHYFWGQLICGLTQMLRKWWAYL